MDAKGLSRSVRALLPSAWRINSRPCLTRYRTSLTSAVEACEETSIGNVAILKAWFVP